MASAGPRSGRRGQTAPLGVALVFAVMIVTTTAVVAFGSDAIGTTQDRLDLERTEKSMTQLKSRSAMVALGQSDAQRVALPATGSSAYCVNEDAGWMNVSYRNTSSGETKTVFNETMGEVVYAAEGGDRIAYQGGGLWRGTRENGSLMVSPPEFHYREATITLPLVTVSGDPSVGNSVRITRNRSTQYYPNTTRDGNFTNPLRDGKMTVTVQSDYYRGWGQYFETRTGGDVRYDHANDRVTLLLTVPADYPSLEAGVVSGSPGSTLTIDNNVVMDSYNSSVGPYAGGGSNTKVVVAGDLVVEKGEIYGNVEVGGDMTFDHNNGRLYDGNISYGGGYSEKSASNWQDGPNNWKNDNASVSAPDSVAGVIGDRGDALRDPSENDNDTTAAVDAGAIDYGAAGPSDEATVPAGDYYLSALDVPNGKTLTLDTSGGDVDIYVENDLSIDRGEIEVTGPNRVNVYLEGDAAVEGQNGNAEVSTPGDDSTQFWLYMNPDRQIEFGSKFSVTGVVYGPGQGPNEGVDLVLTAASSGSEIKGAFVGGATTINNVQFYYDEALANADTVEQNSQIPAVTYVHASTNDVNVTAG